MEPDDHERQARFEADLARRIRDAVVNEVPRRPVLEWAVAGVTLLALAALVFLLLR